MTADDEPVWKEIIVATVAIVCGSIVAIVSVLAMVFVVISPILALALIAYLVL